MGQAQRRERQSIPQSSAGQRRSQASADRRRKQQSTRNRTGSPHRSGSGNDISVIYGNENIRLMRLADREPNRSKKSPSDPIRRSFDGPRAASAVRRRKAKRRKVLLYRCCTLLVVGICLILIYQTAGAVYRIVHDKKTGKEIDKNNGIVEVISEKLGGNKVEPPAITEDFLEINDYSRPGTKLNKVKSIFVHYTANPGTSAQQNRSYFANLAETHERSASAHFIIGYDGEIVQCIPLEEQAYAVATRNEDSISIECCYQDEEGKFTQDTYDSLVHMLAWLTQEYHLSPDDILRHYDCGGKMCPIYYVEHEDAWEQLLADVENYEPEETK